MLTTQGFERFCPTCKNKNNAGMYVCAYCGTPLGGVAIEPNTTRQVDELESVTAAIGEQFVEELSPPSEGVALYIFGSTTPIAVRTDHGFVIGRAAAGTPGPLIDLSEFDGFAMGVSRQHVMIRPTKNGYDLIDLESRNGTWLNDQRLVPNRAYPLPNRAQIRLGMMRLIVLYQPPSGSDQQA